MTAPYDLILGLDRADTKADLCLLETATGQCRCAVVDTAPEALCEWLAGLRQQHPQARVGLCLEQSAVHILPFLEAYDWITLHLINPITLQKYREAFVTSRAKDDTQDAEFLADLLLDHHAQLPVWAPQDSATCAVQQLVVHRHAVVDERTALSNRLIALLKQYFPQALTLRRRLVGAAGGRGNVRRGGRRTARRPDAMKRDAQGSTVRACPAQIARATRTGRVCAWHADIGGESVLGVNAGCSVVIGQRLHCVAGGRRMAGEGGQGLGRAQVMGVGVRLSAKRPDRRPTNL